MTTYQFPLVEEFIDRSEELARLESWWGSSDRMPVNLYGRRRVGKSWLLRRFAHDKPAVILVAERLAEGAQLERFSSQLAPLRDGVPPSLPDVAALIRTLYRASRSERLLVIIDEFPWLLGTTATATEQILSQIQAVIEEERDSSQLKLILCGSSVAQMEALQSEKSPLHGRLSALELRPVEFAVARQFLDVTDPLDAFTRYAVAGGMPRYLMSMRGPTLEKAVCAEILRPDAPLWNEGRSIVEQSLRESSVYFALLEKLSSSPKAVNELASPLRMKSDTVAPYLAKLQDLRLVRRRLPPGASPTSRGGQWTLEDPFLRFWFRFVFPFQADLETGLDPVDLYRTEIEPVLAEHVSPVFEEWCRSYVRASFGSQATTVYRWWGNSLDRLRRSKERTTEEIDIVGQRRGRVTLVGEARWTQKPMRARTLHDLHEFKLPALRQDGFKIAQTPRIVLLSKSGYSPSIVEQASTDERLTLVDVPAVLAEV